MKFGLRDSSKCHKEAVLKILTLPSTTVSAADEALQELWPQSIDVRDADMRSKIHGVSMHMKSFDFFFGLMLGEFILKHSDNLNKTLQSRNMSAAEAQKIAEMIVSTLQSVRNAEIFELFWTKMTKVASDIDVNDPVLPRQRKNQEGMIMVQQKGIFPQMFKPCIDQSFLKL